MVRTKPSCPITTPWPIRSVPSAEAVKASLGTSECTCTTDWSAASRLKRNLSWRGCRRSGKAHSIVSAMIDTIPRKPGFGSFYAGSGWKVTAGQEHTSPIAHTCILMCSRQKPRFLPAAKARCPRKLPGAICANSNRLAEEQVGGQDVEWLELAFHIAEETVQVRQDAGGEL